MRCPTCGKEYGIVTAGELARVMAQFNVDCYEGSDRNFYLERGKGPVERDTIYEALQAGLIKNRWNDAPPAVKYWTVVK